MKEPQEPIVCVGTTFDVSGHKATVIAITKDGVQVKMPDVYQPMMVDFDKIEEAVFGKS